MTSKDKINFQSSCGFFGFGQEESDLNYRLSQVMREKRREEDRRMRERAQTAASHEGLHDKDNDQSAPFKQLVISQTEQEEIDAILAELDDIPAVSSCLDTAPEPKKAEVTLVPTLTEPEPVAEADSNSVRECAESGELDEALSEVRIDLQSEETLLKRYKGLFSDDRPLSPDEVTLADKIAEELTKRRKPPIERGVSAFDPPTCRSNKTAKFKSNLLQVHDQQWIHGRHPGHLTDCSAWKGIFADIFAPSPFDRDRAMKISRFGRGGLAEKVKCLNLSESQQRELVVLRGDDENKRRHAIRQGELRQARADRERLLQIGKEVAEVRCRLTEYEARTPRARLNIDEHVLIWRCLAMCEGEKNYVAGAMREYENLTGGVKSRKTFRDKIDKLESILAGSTLVKWRGQ